MYIFFYVEIKNKNKSTTRNICNIHLNFFSCLLCGVKLLQNKRKNTISEMLYIVSTLKSIQMNVLLLHGCSLAFFLFVSFIIALSQISSRKGSILNCILLSQMFMLLLLLWLSSLQFLSCSKSEQTSDMAQQEYPCNSCGSGLICLSRSTAEKCNSLTLNSVSMLVS